MAVFLSVTAAVAVLAGRDGNASCGVSCSPVSSRHDLSAAAVSRTLTPA
jgi:hypothetical protein